MKKILVVIAFGLLSITLAKAQNTQEQVTTVFLFRHAEPYFPPYKEDPPDPSLNFAGQERARLLALKLRDIDIHKIYSTERKRTQETVAPIAKQKGLDVESYDPEGLEDLSKTILQNPGTYLVSGHSNTTPQLVALLGGEPGEPIRNSSEFDRLYMLVILKDTVLTYQLRYGSRYE